MWMLLGRWVHPEGPQAPAALGPPPVAPRGPLVGRPAGGQRHLPRVGRLCAGLRPLHPDRGPAGGEPGAGRTVGVILGLGYDQRRPDETCSPFNERGGGGVVFPPPAKSDEVRERRVS